MNANTIHLQYKILLNTARNKKDRQRVRSFLVYLFTKNVSYNSIVSNLGLLVEVQMVLLLLQEALLTSVTIDGHTQLGNIS